MWISRRRRRRQWEELLPRQWTGARYHCACGGITAAVVEALDRGEIRVRGDGGTAWND